MTLAIFLLINGIFLGYMPSSQSGLIAYLLGLSLGLEYFQRGDIFQEQQFAH